jgi:RNA recognition motif-containing protein
VYFGGVAREATDEEFKDVAARGGGIAAVERRRGYAYVTYATIADADAAVTALNGTELAGRKMTVEKSKPAADRPERPAREPAPIGDRPVHKNRIVVRNLPREFDADALQKSFIRECAALCRATRLLQQALGDSLRREHAPGSATCPR